MYELCMYGLTCSFLHSRGRISRLNVAFSAMPNPFLNKICLNQSYCFSNSKVKVTVEKSLVEKETYLGFIMNSCDKEDDTICKETRALCARGNMLLGKFGHCTVDVKKNLFMTYCSSLYCCSLWSAYDYTTLRSIHCCS